MMEHVSSTQPWVSNQTAQRILTTTQNAYSPIILAIFLVSFMIHSIVTASQKTTLEPSPTQFGPGGKPLPRKSPKPSRSSLNAEQLNFSPRTQFIFRWLSVGVLLTFFLNAVNVISHTIVERGSNWWCGQATVVSFNCCNLLLQV